MMKAANAGPEKVPMPPVRMSGSGLLYDRMPRPSLESHRGNHTSHVPA
jgi:hypothetical protein